MMATGFVLRIEGRADMDKTAGFALGSFLLVGGFVWIVFDSLVLGLMAGLFAGSAAARTGAKPGGHADR